MDHLEEELDEVEPPDEFGGHLNNPTHSKKFVEKLSSCPHRPTVEINLVMLEMKLPKV